MENNVRHEVLGRLRHDGTVRQLLLVETAEGSEALAHYYIKGAAGWRLRAAGSAFIGKHGTGKQREGDLKTPCGDLRPLRAFGILPDPGSLLPFLRIVPGTVACDAKGPHYNRIIQTDPSNGGPEELSGERMWELSPEYSYGIETDYNAAGIWPLGSAIFVHCKGNKKWTGGCIALDLPFMKKVLTTADEGLLISIR